jgi:hypothetical protein
MITVSLHENLFFHFGDDFGIVFSFLFGNIAMSQVMAESGIGKDVFKVIVTLYGISDSTKDVVTLVNVGDQTKVKVYNAEDAETGGLDKVSYTMAFPNLAVENGEI